MRPSSLSSRLVVRSSLLLVATAAALGACGDDDPPTPVTTLLDGGGRSSSGSTADASRGDGTVEDGATSDSAPDTGSVDTGSPQDAGGGDVDAQSPPDADASAQADADADAGASSDAGGDHPVGMGPFLIAYAGRNFGIDTRIVASYHFSGNGLDAWTPTAPANEAFERGTTTVSSAGTVDALLAFGRWSDGVAKSGANDFTWPANGGALYVIGQRPTSVPTTGTAALTQVAAPSAIVSDGSSAPGTISGTAALAYLADGSVGVGFDISLVVGGDSYTISSAGGTAAPATSDAVASKTTLLFGATYSVTSGSALCGGTCTASVQGFVAGPGAERLAILAHVFKGTGGAEKTVSGALVFKKP